MGLIREPLDVDFYVDNTAPSSDDYKKISEAISKLKEKNSRKRTSSLKTVKLPKTKQS